MGRQPSDSASSARWIGGRRSQCAYAYPARSAAWKKSRQVVHTAGPPPNHGSTKRPIMGWISNRRNALRKMAKATRPAYHVKSKTGARSMLQKITPFLWFDNNAEEAVNFYTS